MTLKSSPVKDHAISGLGVQGFRGLGLRALGLGV